MDKLPVTRVMALQGMTYVFLCAFLWGRFDGIIPAVLLLAAVSCIILAAQTKCPNCNASLLKTVRGWWAPMITTHCRTCGYSNHPSVSSAVGDAGFFPTGQRHWSVLVTSLIFGVMALDFFFLTITNDAAPSVGFVSIIAYAFTVSIWLLAAYFNADNLNGLGKVCGISAAIFTMIIMAASIWGEDYFKAVVLFIFASILRAMSRSAVGSSITPHQE